MGTLGPHFHIKLGTLVQKSWSVKAEWAADSEGVGTAHPTASFVSIRSLTQYSDACNRTIYYIVINLFKNVSNLVYKTFTIT